MRRKSGIYSEYAIAAFAIAAQYRGETPGRNVSAALRADLAAVGETFAMMDAEHVAAVKAIYRPYRESCYIPGNILHERTLAHAEAVHYSEETVYRFLAKARKTFAECRGLTVK